MFQGLHLRLHGMDPLRILQCLKNRHGDKNTRNFSKKIMIGVRKTIIRDTVGNRIKSIIKPTTTGKGDDGHEMGNGEGNSKEKLKRKTKYLSVD